MRLIRLAPLLLSIAAATTWAGETVAPAHTVTVTGEGEATAQPDRARLSVSAEARNADLKAAETQVNTAARGFLAELKKLGIADEDITASAYSVSLEYDWVNNQQKFRGYHAVRGFEITVRDLNRLGDVLLKATQAGINQVNAPMLESSQTKAAQRSALARATEDALAQAKVMATALGVKLGAALAISANDARLSPPVPMVKAMAVRASAADAVDGNTELGFSAGLLRSTASVTASFELLP
jgi:uncharacterized protein